MKSKFVATLVCLIAISCGGNGAPQNWTKADSQKFLKDFTLLRIQAQFSEKQNQSNLKLLFKLSSLYGISFPWLIEQLKKDYPKVMTRLLPEGVAPAPAVTK